MYPSTLPCTLLPCHTPCKCCSAGLITLLQTTIGDRLPIIQGGSFAYLTPAFAIIAQISATHKFATEHDRFVYTMRELQVRYFPQYKE